MSISSLEEENVDDDDLDALEILYDIIEICTGQKQHIFKTRDFVFESRELSDEEVNF